MQISFSYKVAKQLINDNSKLSQIIKNIGSYHFRNYLSEPDAKEDGNVIRIDLAELDSQAIKLLNTELFNFEYVSKKTITTVSMWVNALKNPNNVPITSLKNFEKIFIAAVKKNKKRWVAMQNPDGNIVLCAVTNVKYSARRRDEDACVCVSLDWIGYTGGSSNRWDDDKSIELKKKSSTRCIYQYDLGDIIDDSYDDDDIDEDLPVKKKKQTAKTLMEILSSNGIYLVSDEEIEKQESETNELANKIRKKIGSQYISKSKAYVVMDGRSYGDWKVINTDDDIVSKLVVDVFTPYEGTSFSKSDLFGEIDLPEHPYVCCYNISHYNYAVVHAQSLVEYVYDDNVIDKLIISNKKKKVLKSLISNENNFNDIISGKSGGIIVLSTGPAGVGKTLTAEVYSELIRKPLYSIQSSQLGIKVEDIEKNLNKILYRANVWNAILLIDEADSYVYKRGADILQNCIVGTFLRLLEYYNGILFLTSNRPEEIDDAIMSRVTIHLKYDVPTMDEFKMLWDVLPSNMGMKTEKNIDEKFFHKYKFVITGRDIRNLIKDIKKCYPNESVITMDMIDELCEFLPFMNKK